VLASGGHAREQAAKQPHQRKSELEMCALKWSLRVAMRYCALKGAAQMDNLTWCALTCLVARRWMRLGGGGRLGGSSLEPTDRRMGFTETFCWMLKA
jgi:hypothetical protein